ncbi:MAG: hypothetical protein H7Z13_09275 [Ferruginibacter sp.]|nr:hypothetical protein [Ferruginibacter sp.]
MKSSKPINENGSDNVNSAEVWVTTTVSYVQKEERIFQRLISEKRELQKKKSSIENRLIEIQNDLNVRREEIRSGR